MLVSIMFFGAFALPFAGLTKQDYNHLNALAALYILLTTTQGVYTVIEGSYIPIFMRSAGWHRSSVRLNDDDNQVSGQQRRTWKKGFSVSVLAMVASNVGGLVSLIIGIILVYGRGSYVKTGYFNYLLAITIAGCITSKDTASYLYLSGKTTANRGNSRIRPTRPLAPPIHPRPRKTQRPKHSPPPNKRLVPPLNLHKPLPRDLQILHRLDPLEYRLQ